MDYKYKIILKNNKTLRLKRLIITSYRLCDKEIICSLIDGTKKQYQRNEWYIIDCIRERWGI